LHGEEKKKKKMEGIEKAEKPMPFPHTLFPFSPPM